MGVHFFCFFLVWITWLIILMDNNKDRDMGNNLDLVDNNLGIIHMGPNNNPMELNNKPITLTEELSKAIILTVVVLLLLVDIALQQVDRINLQHNLKQHITHGTPNTTIKSNKLNFKSCKHGLLVLILIAVDPSQHTNFKK